MRSTSTFRETVPFVELHPTNACNQQCEWCTYRDADRSLHLRFEDLDVLDALSPEEILIAGGGEPTLYRSPGGERFGDLVRRVRLLVGRTCRIRLITNGTTVPPGPWAKEIAEISVSLDVPNAASYREKKGSDAFDAVMRNIEWYLCESPIPSVRVTEVYDRSSLQDGLELAARLWRLHCGLTEQKRLRPTKAKRFSFMIFPMADDRSADRPYQTTQLSHSVKSAWRDRMAQLQRESPGLWKFVQSHTNLASQPLADLPAPPVPRCPAVTNYALLAADGHFFPCFAMCAHVQDANLGRAVDGAGELLRRREELFLNLPERCSRGCRPGSTFYGRRAYERFIEQFRGRVFDRAEEMVNTALARKVVAFGIERIESECDLSKERGIIWFPERIKYKYESSVEPAAVVYADGPSVPRKASYLIQYNESRGVSRGDLDKWNGKGEDRRPPCPFCRIPSDFVLDDLEHPFGIPFALVADSRPFFPRHMLAIAKRHTGGMAYAGFRDLVWLLNAVFPGLRGNVGTGNQADHLHTHLFDAELPIERLAPSWFVEGDGIRVGLLENELNLTYFVIESEDIDRLASGAYQALVETERGGLLACVILARHRVYVVPQTRKSLSDDPTYPGILKAFKETGCRPPGLRPRYVGPIEMAGVWLCYSRGEIAAMRQMFEDLDFATYRRGLRDVGLAVSAPKAKDLRQRLEADIGAERRIVSLQDARAADRRLVGGKAKGLHALGELADRTVLAAERAWYEKTSASPFTVPEGFVLTTELFEELVLGSAAVRGGLEDLEARARVYGEASPSEKRAALRELSRASETVRQAITALAIPRSLQKRITTLLAALGGNLAVRSSATIEDQAEMSAAGLARTVLGVRTASRLIEAVREVLASLYGTDFVLEAVRKGLSVSEARMAVILQPMIQSRSAGVAVSVDSHGRPAYSICARAGRGDAVVVGGRADSWLVSPDANDILEPAEKGRAAPCMTDDEVLRLASVVQLARVHFRVSHGFRHVDIEFSLSWDREIVLLQCRPVTTASKAEEVLVSVVDVAATTRRLKRVSLDPGICACEGTAVGELQVLTGNDEIELIGRVKPGSIAVIRGTTSRWNRAFHALEGVITQVGNDLCHAAIHARELRIPAVVNMPDAFQLLELHDGKTVTLDAANKILYLGRAPVKQEIRTTSIWSSDERSGDSQRAALTSPGGSGHHPNLLIDFEGRWFARPKIPYGYWQLSCYREAFAWYRRKLANLDWPSGLPGTDGPEIPEHVLRIKDRILYERQRCGELPDVAFMRILTLDDCAFLMEERWKGFERIVSFFDDVQDLNADNIERAVDGLVELLGWNSFGHAFRTAFDQEFLTRQTRHIAPAFLPLMMRAAFSEARELGDIRCDLVAAQQKQLLAVCEEIRADPAAREVLATADLRHPYQGVEALRKARPEFFARLEELSRRYKLATEDLRVLDDSAGYLRWLKDRIESRDPGVDLEQLAAWCEAVADVDGVAAAILEEIKRRDPGLAFVIRTYARSTANGGAEDPDEEHVLRVIETIKGQVAGTRRRSATVRAALENYPTLKKTLAIARSEALFRNNAHHLLVRCQRRIAPLMLRTAERHSSIFNEAEAIFDIGKDELVALLRDEDPTYIRDTFDRNSLLEEAERDLQRRWAMSPLGALEAYSEFNAIAVRILARQREAARNERVRAYYLQEQRALRRRMDELKILAVAEAASEECL